MTEVWLHRNRRAFASGIIIFGGMLLYGIYKAWQFWELQGPWVPIISVLDIVLLGSLLAGVLWAMFRPMLAYEAGELLAYLRAGKPIRVPIEIVEGFLMGKQETKIGWRRREVSTLVIRLSEKATEWAKVEVHPTVGRWCGGYINIFGTWCEPLSVELVNKLNARLAEVTKQHAASQVAS